MRQTNTRFVGDATLLSSGAVMSAGGKSTSGQAMASASRAPMQMTVYGASGGASITGSFDRSKESERSTTYNNTTLTADNIDLITSGDANIRGANVHANQHLEADIQGDLNLESMQNRSNSRNTSMGVSGGFSLGGQQGDKSLGQAINGNAFTNNLQGTGNVGGVAGVNGGISSGNGMSVTRETVLTSLTSGGTANVNVGGHTQITGALLATIDDEGNDLNKLNFSTGSLNFTDLRNISQNSQTNAGVSANFSVGEQKADDKKDKKVDVPNPREGQTIAEGANGNTLYANTSNLTYSNSQENSASKTLATLGHGNITVGGTQLEKDGELTEAGKANGSPLIGMNRDTANTEKELWNSEQSQTVDATLDVRLLNLNGGWADIQDNTEKVFNGLASYFSDINPELKAQTGDAGSRAYDAARRMGLSDSEATAMLSDPETLNVLMQLNKAEGMLNQPVEKVVDSGNSNTSDVPVIFTGDRILQTVVVKGEAISYNAIETATFAMDDASRYINELRETNPKKAAVLEGVISVATGGPLKAAIGKGVEIGLNQSGLGEKAAEQTKKITDPIIEAGASGIAGYNPTVDEFRANMEETGADGDESKLKGGTGFFISSVLGVTGGVGGKGKDSDSTVGVNGNNSGNATTNTPDTNIVSVNAGSKNNWDKAINGQLDPNKTYQLNNGHAYQTDSQGRVAEVEADLSRTTMDRNNYQQCTTGKCGNPGDEGGHLIASSLGGAGDKINIVPQAQLLNRGDWKTMENSFRDVLKDGGTVSVKIEVGYPPVGTRPSSFRVIAEINGVEEVFNFKQ